MSRYIIVEIDKADIFGKENVFLKVIHQSHRCACLTANGDMFSASNGVVLKSYGAPNFYEETCMLNVCGYDETQDGTVIHIPIEHYTDVMDAIDEYNIKYADKPRQLQLSLYESSIASMAEDFYIRAQEECEVLGISKEDYIKDKILELHSAL